MKPFVIQTDFSIQAIQVNQVMFDHSDLVSVECQCRLQNQLSKTTLLFTFSVFNDFLRHSGSMGIALQDAVSDKLLGNEQPPYTISLHDKPLVFTNCKLDLAYLIAQDNTCMSVESVSPISFLQQAQNLKNNIRDFGNVQLSKSGLVQHALYDIASLYKYYEGLKELDVTEWAAREKAGLLNEKIFKIAYYAANRG
jgi:hypothetical protein